MTIRRSVVAAGSVLLTCFSGPPSDHFKAGAMQPKRDELRYRILAAVKRFQVLPGVEIKQLAPRNELERRMADSVVLSDHKLVPELFVIPEVLSTGPCGGSQVWIALSDLTERGLIETSDGDLSEVLMAPSGGPSPWGYVTANGCRVTFRRIGNWLFACMPDAKQSRTNHRVVGKLGSMSAFDHYSGRVVVGTNVRSKHKFYKLTPRGIEALDPIAPQLVEPPIPKNRGAGKKKKTRRRTKRTELTAQEETVRAHLDSGWSQVGIAKKLGLSPSRISQVKASINRKKPRKSRALNLRTTRILHNNISADATPAQLTPGQRKGV